MRPQPPQVFTVNDKDSWVHWHDNVDVAIIELPIDELEEGMTPAVGMVFRDPAWSDDAFVFGYPYVPLVDDPAGRPITNERGQVVNPSTLHRETGEPIFLHSAAIREGSSGGPIVAGDGHVIGLAVEGSNEAGAAPFFVGIPPSEVVRALHEINPDYAQLVRVEDWR